MTIPCSDMNSRSCMMGGEIARRKQRDPTAMCHEPKKKKQGYFDPNKHESTTRMDRNVLEGEWETRSPGEEGKN